jgi:2-iminobutanoate/2-iminopropanoate deaminase
MKHGSQLRSWQPLTLGAGYPPPKGAYSPAVRAGNLLFISGQVPRDPKSGELPGPDFASQTRRVLENLRLALQAGGATFDHLVAVTVYLVNVDDWDAFNEIYRSTLRAPYPSRTVVGASLRGILIEVSAIACVPG